MNRFINAGKILSTTPQELYICPANSHSVIHTLFFSSRDLENCRKITVQVYDASEGMTFDIAYQVDVSPRTTLSFDKPINLDANDSLRVFADIPNTVHAFASVMHVIPMSL